MDKLLSNLRINVKECIYVKNPESSDLGKKIIGASIELIERIGFEAFTFKKLAQHIESTEASIYRYFESKHKLLLYLTSWYWGWMQYRLVFGVANIPSAEERLHRAITMLTQEINEDGTYPHINETLLNRVVIAESSKVYMTKLVDQENSEGVFLGYKELVAQVSTIIQEINPDYKYPNMLVSTVIEGAHHQRYFAEHLPRLTNVIQGEDAITEFYKELVLKAIKN